MRQEHRAQRLQPFHGRVVCRAAKRQTRAHVRTGIDDAGWRLAQGGLPKKRAPAGDSVAPAKIRCYPQPINSVPHTHCGQPARRSRRRNKLAPPRLVLVHDLPLGGLGLDASRADPLSRHREQPNVEQESLPRCWSGAGRRVSGRKVQFPSLTMTDIRMDSCRTRTPSVARWGTAALMRCRL